MVLGVVGYVVLARPRGFVPALIAVLPPTAIAVIWAYNAELLARPDPTTAGAVDQGQEVFFVLLLCSLAAAGAVALRADPHGFGRAPAAHRRRRAVRATS